MLVGLLLALADSLAGRRARTGRGAGSGDRLHGRCLCRDRRLCRSTADIAQSGASAPAIRLLAGEVALSQAFHPPGPCLVACVPSFAYRASAALLVLVDYQVGLASGLIPRAGCPGGCGLPGCPGGCAFPGCPGGCSFPPEAARSIDGDIRAMFADPTLIPPGPPALPTFGPGTTP